MQIQQSGLKPPTEDPAALPASTLIICSRNRPRLLVEVVDSVLAGEAVPQELIIIDQSDKINPALESYTTERECVVRYVWTDQVGLSRAENRGIALASHELLTFTHDDVQVAPDWYATIVKALVEAGPKGIVSGQVQISHEEVAGGFQLAQKVEKEGAVYAGRINKDVLLPLNMAMYRSAPLAIGGFDARLGPGTPFPAAEDNDFGFRLLEKGYRIIYVPQAVIYHRAWREEDSYIGLRWAYGLGRGAFYAKHLSLRDRYILKRMIRDILVHFGLFFRRTRGEFRLVCGDAVLSLGIIYGALKWLMTRRKTA